MTSGNSIEDLQKVVSASSNLRESQTDYASGKVDTTPPKTVNKLEEQKRPQTVTKILVTANKTTQGAGQTGNAISVKKTTGTVNRMQETNLIKNLSPPLYHKPAVGEPYRHGKTAQGARTKRGTDSKVPSEIGEYSARFVYSNRE